MKILILTQYKENYGAHNWDGIGECPQRWKFKGGTTYVIENLTTEEVDKILKEEDKLNQLIEYKNVGSEEYVLGYSTVKDDKVLDINDCVFLKEEDGDWYAEIKKINDEYGYMIASIAEKNERYKMLPNGERENYNVSFLMVSGEVLNSDELNELVNNKKKPNLK